MSYNITLKQKAAWNSKTAKVLMNIYPKSPHHQSTRQNSNTLAASRSTTTQPVNFIQLQAVVISSGPEKEMSKEKFIFSIPSPFSTLTLHSRIDHFFEEWALPWQRFDAQISPNYFLPIFHVRYSSQNYLHHINTIIIQPPNSEIPVPHLPTNTC